jgi:superfamily II DNA or RNA helicase
MNYKETLLELLKNVTAWPDLKEKIETFNTSKTDTTEKNTVAGKLFEYFAKYYFIVDATQRQLYDNVWLYEEIDSLIKEELGLPMIDKGVDLLLKDVQGRYTVVQCKFKNNEESIVHFGKDKLANTFFWSKKCFGVVLFTNVADCTDDIKKEKNFNAIKSDTLLNIDSSIFASIRNYINSNTPPLVKKHEPQPHQELAIMKVVKHFEANDRGQLILPCGAGKTTTSLWIKESLKSKSTLVLFPSLALLRQFKTEWAEQKSEEYIYINICSEKDIDKNKDDSPVIHTYEISGEVTTSSVRVKEFLMSEFEQKIVFSTYQSIVVIQQSLLEMPDFFFDLIICDEAHRTSGGAKKNTFAIVHDQTKIRGKKRLYMTATPRVVSVQLKAKLGEDYALLCDMSNPEIYGEEAFRMSFGEAITQNILVDYKIVGIGVTEKQVKQFIEQRRYVTADYDLKEIADNYALNLVMDKYSAFHAITFHSRIKFAQEFSKRHNSYFGPTVYSNHVSGDDKTSKRADILRRFKKHDKGVVSNARCLTEGVDVPIIDLIYFCDPKNSKIDIVQASGRALRKDRHGKKPIGYIVVPIFHHIDEDIEKEIEKKPYFQNLIQVIRSLCDQDERLQAEIDEVAFNKGERTSKRLVVDYGDNEIEKIITFDGIEKEVKKYLFDQIIEKTRDNWNVMFSNLVEFKNAYGTTNVTRKYDGYETLRWWVQAQRDNYFKNKLTAFQLKMLNEIGFEWKGKQRREIKDKFEIWMLSYRRLVLYFDEYGNVDIPARYEKDKSLATWLVTQRVKYDEAKLSDEQIDLLESVKINWDPKNTYPQFIEALFEYKKRFGNTRVPQGHPEYNKVAVKCARVRAIYRFGTETKNGDIVSKGKGRITKWAIEKLKDMEFEWSVGSPEWDESFGKIKKYFDENGDSNVKATENQTLFYWCYRQRRDKKDLEPEQIEKLHSINFVFQTQKNTNEKAFFDKLTILKNYYDEQNAGSISFDKETERKIQKWESGFRTAYRQGELLEERFSLLIGIGFSFEEKNTEENVWLGIFDELLKYYNEFGTFDIDDTPEFRRIRNWIRYQRTLYNKKQLKEERTQKLISAGYSFERQNKTVSVETKEKIAAKFWERKFEELQAFLLKNTSLHGIEVLEDKQGLWRWLKKVILDYKKGTLADDKVVRLREISFDFKYHPQRTREKKIKPDFWEERFEEFKKFYELKGTFYIPLKDEGFRKIASWLRKQKSLYKQGLLSEERVNKFIALGFSLIQNYKPIPKKFRKERDEETWILRFEQFKAYHENTGSFYILMSDKENAQLRVWVQSQIANYRREKLSQDKIEKLASVGFRFEQNQITKEKPVKAAVIKKDTIDSWNRQYLALIEFKVINGDCYVPRNHSNTSLAYWVSEQRTKYNRNQLSEDKIIKLNLLGFNWGKVKSESEKDVWLRTYNKLKAFYKQYGNSSPTIEYGDEQLQQWIMQQRHRRKKGILKVEYFKLLEAVKFNWSPNPNGGSGKPQDDVWLKNYQKLVEYKNKFSTTNVSQSNKEHKALGKWVNDQRHCYKKGKLSRFRIGKLNEIEFVWDARLKVN